MLNFLQEYLQKLYSNFQENGQNISIIKPYLKDTNLNNIPLEFIELTLYIPHMLSELVDYMIDESTDELLRAFASSIYSYVFNPFDYIPDTSESILSFIDDALIVFYGLKKLETIQSVKEFSVIKKKEIINAIQYYESCLDDSLLEEIKSFSLEVDRIIEKI